MLKRLLARAGARFRALSLSRSALATGVLAALSLAPSAALAMSPGCQIVNDGGYTRGSTTNYHLSHGFRFVRGDVVDLQYTQTRPGGTLRFVIGDTEYNATDASGTITVSIEELVQGISLTSTWQGDYSTIATCTPGPDVPVGNDQLVELAPDTTDHSIYLSYAWNSAPATASHISTPPGHGSAVITSQEVLYTPDAGYVGLDTFQFVGTNAEGDSQPATVTIRVAPGLDISPNDGSQLPQASIDQPYSTQFTGINCVGSCTFELSDRSFDDADLSLDATTGVLSGAVRSFNIYNGEPEHSLQIYLSDESGATRTFEFTLPIVESDVPTAGASSTTIPANSSNQQLDLVYARAPRGVEVTVQPAHGTARVDGLRIFYTPDLNFMGSDQLTFVATNNFGASSPAIATILVDQAQGGQIYPATGPLPDASTDEPYEIQIEIIDQTATFTYTGTLPPGLALDGATGLLSGTPTADGAGQTYTFSVTGQGGNWWDDPQTANYTLKVVEAGVTATDKIVEIVPGTTPLPVDLTAGATGGPFTDAAILSIEPPDAGTARLTMGEVATIDPDWVPGTFYLKFIPNPNFKGTAVIHYALRGNAGISNNASVTFTVPLGVAAIANQVDGLVHGFVVSRQNRLAAMVDHPGLVDRRRGADGQQPGTVEISPSEAGVTMNFASSLAQVNAWNAAGSAAGALANITAPNRFNAWIDGQVALHVRNQDSLEYTGSLALLSLGADYLVNDKLLAGLAFHIDTMDDRAGMTRTDGKGLLIGPYISAEIGDGVFLDASLLYGHSWNEVTNGYFSGAFETNRLLGKASIEGNWSLDENLTLRPDLTLAITHEQVSDYTVSNGLGDEITVAGFGSTQARLSAGGTLEYRLVLENGLSITPELNGSLAYSTIGASRLGEAIFGTIGTGLTLTGDGNWSLGGNVEVELDGNGARGASARSSLSADF